MLTSDFKKKSEVSREAKQISDVCEDCPSVPVPRIAKKK